MNDEKKPDNPQAFPSGPTNNWSAPGPDGLVHPLREYGWEGTSGMTLRDWFAGYALSGIVAAQEWRNDMVGLGQGSVESDATEAYRLADAMLRQREK